MLVTIPEPAGLRRLRSGLGGCSMSSPLNESRFSSGLSTGTAVSWTRGLQESQTLRRSGSPPCCRHAPFEKSASREGGWTPGVCGSGAAGSRTAQVEPAMVPPGRALGGWVARAALTWADDHGYALTAVARTTALARVYTRPAFGFTAVGVTLRGKVRLQRPPRPRTRSQAPADGGGGGLGVEGRGDGAGRPG